MIGISDIWSPEGSKPARLLSFLPGATGPDSGLRKWKGDGILLPHTPPTVLPTHLLLSLPRPPCVPTPFKITCCNKEASALIPQTHASVFEGKWEKSKAHLPLCSLHHPVLSADVPAKCACAPAGIPEAGEQKPRPTAPGCQRPWPAGLLGTLSLSRLIKPHNLPLCSPGLWS